ncbi:hypothetical protein EZS27_017749 [termite gut metagenome]|uniref:Uncharacterized protein n=1 Tax=termite gut metagenome TaxID=433724 RepID=A0A5J4RL52_9ZZZZ
MEKKFMKYLLFGVFTFVLGIAFVGCGEDYDDDISSLKSADATLQKALDDLKAAAVTSDQLTAAVAATAKTEAEKALAGLTEGSTTQEVASVLGQLIALDSYFAADTKFASAVSALSGLTGDLATKAGLGNLYNTIVGHSTAIAALKLQVAALSGDESGEFADLIESIDARIKALEAAGGIGGDPNYDAIATALAENPEFVNAIIAKIKESNPGLVTLGAQVNGLITSISLISSSDVTFNAVASKASITFGEAGKLVFEKDKILKEAVTKDILVQVSPANAVLDPAKISLVNSKGDDAINDFITIESAVPYEGLLTRAGESTGIYKVTLALDPETYNSAALKAVIYKDPSKKDPTVDGNKIAFALTVEDKISDADRSVSTGFDLAFIDQSNADPAYTNELGFSVEGVSTVVVGQIRNRYIAGNTGVEKAWINISQNADHSNPTSSTSVGNAGANDSRAVQRALPIEIGKAFKVKVTGLAVTNAFAYYVGLDLPNATTAETTLWAGADIENLGTVYAITQEAEITIKSANLAGREIGFRVYAVNADGTLVDPDGRAFYVVCNGESVQGTELVFGFNISSAPANGKANTNQLTVSLKGINTSDISGYLFNLNDEVKAVLGSDAIGVNWVSGYTGVTLTNVPLYKLKDNETVTLGTLSLVNDLGATLISYDVQVKKELPIRIPTGLKLRGADKNVPQSWEYKSDSKILTVRPNAVDGITGYTEVSYNLTTVIGDVATTSLSADDDELLIEYPTDGTNITLNSANVGIAIQSFNGTLKGNTLSLGKGYDSSKQYQANITYDYGNIAYNEDAPKPYVIKSTETFIIQVESFLKGLAIGVVSGDNLSFVAGTTEGPLLISIGGNDIDDATAYARYISSPSITGTLRGTKAGKNLDTPITISDATGGFTLTAPAGVKNYLDGPYDIKLILQLVDVLGVSTTIEVLPITSVKSDDLTVSLTGTTTTNLKKSVTDDIAANTLKILWTDLGTLANIKVKDSNGTEVSLTDILDQTMDKKYYNDDEITWLYAITDADGNPAAGTIDEVTSDGTEITISFSPSDAEAGEIITLTPTFIGDTTSVLTSTTKIIIKMDD